MNKTAQWIIILAFISLIVSIYIWMNGNKDTGLFVGLWVPSLFALATYLKK